eukprot:scpid96449/ scgid8327/ 
MDGFNLKTTILVLLVLALGVEKRFVLSRSLPEGELLEIAGKLYRFCSKIPTSQACRNVQQLLATSLATASVTTTTESVTTTPTRATTSEANGDIERFCTESPSPAMCHNFNKRLATMPDSAPVTTKVNGTTSDSSSGMGNETSGEERIPISGHDTDRAPTRLHHRISQCTPATRAFPIQVGDCVLSVDLRYCRGMCWSKAKLTSISSSQSRTSFSVASEFYKAETECCAAIDIRRLQRTLSCDGVQHRVELIEADGCECR